MKSYEVISVWCHCVLPTKQEGKQWKMLCEKIRLDKLLDKYVKG